MKKVLNTNKRLLSVFLAFVLILSCAVVCAPMALAQEAELSGVCEQTGLVSGDYRYDITDDETVIITKYLGKATTLTVPGKINSLPVEGIGYEAFANNTTLVTVTIDDSVLTIDDYAFYGCKKLYRIVLPLDLISIGHYAFSECVELSSISASDGIFTIGKDAFYNSIWLRAKNDGVVYFGDLLYGYKGTMPKNAKITVKDGTKYIAYGAFSSQSNMVSLVLPSSIELIDQYAFSNCTNLASVSVNCKTLSDNAFENCLNLKSLTVGSATETIGDKAFSGCKNLASITVPDTVQSIGFDAFADTKWVNDSAPGVVYVGNIACAYQPFNDAKKDSEIVLKDTAIIIGDGAFSGQKVLKKVVLPASLTYVGEEAFSKCPELTRVIIDDAFVTIGVRAFCDCPMLTRILIPNNVKKIEEGALGYKALADGSLLNEGVNFKIFGNKTRTAGERYANNNKPISFSIFLSGDSDSDGKVTILDATAIQKYLAKIIDESKIELFVSDYDNDTDVTVLDATRIQKGLAGLL